MAWPTISRSKRSWSLILSSIFTVLFLFPFGATVSAQQTPQLVKIFFEKEWAGLQSPPPGVGSFRIIGSANWTDGDNNAQSSRATCSYAGIRLSCVYTSTVTSNGLPLNGVGLVAPYGGLYTVIETGLPAGWSPQTGTGNFVAAYNQYCDFTFESGAPITPDDDCSHLLVNSTAPPPSVTVVKTAVTSYTRSYTWEIAKRMSPPAVNLFEGQNANVGYTVQVTRSAPVDSGWQVSGVISVTNSGASAVQLNSVADSIDGVGNVTVTCPAGSVPGNLGANATVVCTYLSALPDGTARTNTATATFNTSLTATGTAAITFGNPTTTVDGTISVQDVYNGGAPETIGTGITGNTSILYTRNVVCGSDLTYVNGVATDPRLNTATIVETEQSANAEMVVLCYRPSVGKTVNPDFTRRFTWEILKTVDPSQINLLAGESTTATYTVTLTRSDAIDENFRVFGTITITNPHPTAALGIIGVTDRLGNGLNATVDCPAQSVPAGGSLDCTYATNVPTNADGTNTATVTATTGIAYNSPVVSYTFIGLPPSQTTLSSVTVTDTNPATGQPWTFSSSGSRSYQVPFACVDVVYNEDGIYQTTVDNTVVISETGQHSTAPVSLTCRVPVGGVNASLLNQCVGSTLVWTVQSNTSGSYTAQLVVETTVIEEKPLSLVKGEVQEFSFTNDAYSPRFVRLLFQGREYAQRTGLTSCAPTSLPLSDEPGAGKSNVLLFLPSLKR